MEPAVRDVNEEAIDNVAHIADLAGAQQPQYRHVPGQRNGHEILIDAVGRWIWHRNGNNGYRCIKAAPHPFACTAYLTFKQGNYNLVDGNHSHANDDELIRTMEIENYCQREAVAFPRRSLRDIFNSAIQRFSPAPPAVTYESIRRTLQRRRAGIVQVIPSTVREAAELTRGNPVFRMNSDRTQPFFDEMVSLREGVEALVFINEELLEGLLESEEIHMDGTFRAAPRLFRQLATLTFFRFGKEEGLYTLCLNRVLLRLRLKFDRVPTPLRLVGDFELAILQSLRNAFPTGRAFGCYFHYGNGVYRHAVHLGLREAYAHERTVAQVIRMTIALSLLPPNYMRDGYQIILDHHGVVNRNLPPPTAALMDTFLEYISSFWIGRIGPDRLSTYNVPRRTNNDMEAFHRNLNRLFRDAHPTYLDFVGIIQEETARMVREFSSAALGVAIRAPRRLDDIRRDRRIATISRELAEQRISIRDFLFVGSNYFEPIRNEETENVQLPVHDDHHLFQEVLNAAAAPLPMPLVPPPPPPLNQNIREGDPLPGPAPQRPRVDENPIQEVVPADAPPVRGRGQGRGAGRGQGRGAGRGQGRGAGRAQGRGAGRGQGRGAGRGAGRGQGRGQGRGRGAGRGGGNVVIPPPGPLLAAELARRFAPNRYRLPYEDSSEEDDAYLQQERDNREREIAQIRQDWAELEVEIVVDDVVLQDPCIICYENESDSRPDGCDHPACRRCLERTSPKHCPQCRHRYFNVVPRAQQ